MKLFQVKLENYKTYYVEALDYSEAHDKVKDYLEFKINEFINEDGSLAVEDSKENKNGIREISVVADFIIR